MILINYRFTMTKAMTKMKMFRIFDSINSTSGSRPSETGGGQIFDEIF